MIGSIFLVHTIEQRQPVDLGIDQGRAVAPLGTRRGDESRGAEALPGCPHRSVNDDQIKRHGIDPSLVVTRSAVTRVISNPAALKWLTTRAIDSALQVEHLPQ